MEGIVSEQTLEELKEYVGFRHFFVHAYCPQLDLERLRPLAEKIQAVTEQFLQDLQDQWL